MYSAVVPAGSARTTWTDERLDDFRDEILSRFEQVDRRLDRIDHRLDAMTERIDALHRTFLIVGGGMMASILIGSAAIVATQL